jgi:hypothetical protein
VGEVKQVKQGFGGNYYMDEKKEARPFLRFEANAPSARFTFNSVMSAPFRTVNFIQAFRKV